LDEFWRTLGRGYICFRHVESPIVVYVNVLFIVMFGVFFLVDRCARKWTSLGLRYAKYAKEDGGVNHAEKAAKYFLKGALFDSSTFRLSLINLGLCYAEGFGLEKDLVKAARCYKIAAKHSSVARLALGFCYAEGLGVEKDMVKSEDLYKKIDWDIGYTLVDRYWNPIEVLMWMRKAAEWGNVIIQRQLADCYKDGINVAKDEAEAAKWYRKAAEQGDASAQFYLGVCYSFGEGVAKDEVEAVKWYRKAAEQGHKDAIEHLEELKKKSSPEAAEERI